MDYKMRRFRQLLPEEETLDILKNGTTGVLASLLAVTVNLMPCLSVMSMPTGNYISTVRG